MPRTGQKQSVAVAIPRQAQGEVFEAAHYPETVQHAAQHRELVNGAVMLLGQFRASTLGIGELLKFLAGNILTTHTQGADRAFITYSGSGR